MEQIIDNIGNRLSGWDVEGPFFKDKEHYLSRDGDNPESPWVGYGWPLNTECWYFVLEGYGLRKIATGITIKSALEQMIVLCGNYD
jgi:hypothetical protein